MKKSKNFKFVVYTNKKAYYFYRWSIAFYFLCTCLEDPGQLTDIETFNEERNVIVKSY